MHAQFIIQVSTNCINIFFFKYSKTIYDQDDVEEAKKIQEKRRNVLPGTYNPSRLSEKPFPLLDLSDAPNPLNAPNYDEKRKFDAGLNDMSAPSTSSNNSNGAITTKVSSNNQRSETAIQQSTSLQTNDEQVGSVTDSSNKLVITIGMLNSALAAALAITERIKEEPVFTPLGEENQQAVEDVFNSSYEKCDDSGDILVCTKDVIPVPIGEKNQYEVKKNDILSGNMAFATNVSILYNIYIQ